jgi:hypothetical protein
MRATRARRVPAITAVTAATEISQHTSQRHFVLKRGRRRRRHVHSNSLRHTAHHHIGQGVFPKDTIAAVYVTDCDRCSYQCAPVDAEGLLSVDFVMRSLKSDVRLTDRVKFHFYFRDNAGRKLKPVCAGHMPLLDHVGSGGAVVIKSNFTSEGVTMHMEPNPESSRNMHLDLLKLHKAQASPAPSCRTQRRSSPLARSWTSP